MTIRTGLGRRSASRPKRSPVRVPVRVARDGELDKIKAIDERVACRGWGPTLRLALLRCSQGVADRLSAPRLECAGHAKLRATAAATGAGLAVVARTRGWL
jgi:hypothetical protein